MFNGKALDDKVAIVTGAGQGIGAAVARAYARPGRQGGGGRLEPGDRRAGGADHPRRGRPGHRAQVRRVGPRRGGHDGRRRGGEVRPGGRAGQQRRHHAHGHAAQDDGAPVGPGAGRAPDRQLQLPAGGGGRHDGAQARLDHQHHFHRRHPGHHRADQLRFGQGRIDRFHQVGGARTGALQHHRQLRRAGRGHADDRDHPHRRTLQARTLERIPLGRWAEPEELAPVWVFLASEGASYVTGQLIGADGGMSIH